MQTGILFVCCPAVFQNCLAQNVFNEEMFTSDLKKNDVLNYLLIDVFQHCNLNTLRITDTPARCAVFSSISQRPSPLFRSQSEKSILTLVTGAEEMSGAWKTRAWPGLTHITKARALQTSALDQPEYMRPLGLPHPLKGGF